MTRSKYFFYPGAEEAEQSKRREAERHLPSEQSAPQSFAFHAGNAELHPFLKESAERTAGDILADLTAMQSRMSSKKTVVPFSSLLSLLFAFCKDFPSVTVQKDIERDIPIATCTHNLLFVIGLIIHHAAANSLPLTVIGGEDKAGPMILLRSDSSSLTPREAAEHLGLSSYRLAILDRVAAASDFSYEIIPADETEIRFHIPLYTPQTYRVFALTDPTLHEAFMQPTLYFLF